MILTGGGCGDYDVGDKMYFDCDKRCNYDVGINVFDGGRRGRALDRAPLRTAIYNAIIFFGKCNCRG